MPHQTNETTGAFDAKFFFVKARQKYIEEPLKGLGFKKYKTSVIARLTKGGVFQFLDFQKSAYGNQDFTVNVGIRPLFCPSHDYLTLHPGNRLGLIATKSKRDKWWNYSTPIEGEASFADVLDLINQFAFPFLRQHKPAKASLRLTKRTSLEKASLAKGLFGAQQAGKILMLGIFISMLDKSKQQLSTSDYAIKSSVWIIGNGHKQQP